jgi:hypothetical protein
LSKIVPVSQEEVERSDFLVTSLSFFKVITVGDDIHERIPFIFTFQLLCEALVRNPGLIRINAPGFTIISKHRTSFGGRSTYIAESSGICPSGSSNCTEVAIGNSSGGSFKGSGTTGTSFLGLAIARSIAVTIKPHREF